MGKQRVEMEVESEGGGGEMKKDVLPHGEQNNLPVNLHTPSLADAGSA